MGVSSEMLQFINPAHTLFVVNPAANSGKCDDEFQTIRTGLNLDQQTSYSIIYTSQNNTDAGKVAAEWLEAETCPIKASSEHTLRIFAVGGDGTLSPVIREFHGRDNVQIGVLPFGTLNDAAHALNLFPKTLQDYKEIINSTNAAETGSYTIEELDKNGLLTRKKAVAYIDAFAGISLATLRNKEAADKTPDCLSRCRCLIGSHLETDLRALYETWKWQGMSISIEDESGGSIYKGDIGNLSMTTLGIIGDLQISPQIRPQWYPNDELKGEIHIAEDGGLIRNPYRLWSLTGSGHRNGCDWSQGYPIEHNKSLVIHEMGDGNHQIELENGEHFFFPIQVTWKNRQATLVAGKYPQSD
ncbi:hypothetical protein D5018_19795 [Parashewanella curva]|uniref:DAGKc domain-containing protein n=1 Tax=Parashewanella curva TaxID=2338552 RepID=A0A3L8PRD7_9GAMM|nr:acylglycerol kinase family protein [Parashewanella curva]RLV57957.1 hypothetical protein D5018_19795 [Parashewanella curva]